MLSWLSMICCECISWIRVGSKGLIFIWRMEVPGQGGGGRLEELVKPHPALGPCNSLLAKQQNILTAERHGHLVLERPDL